MPDIWAPASGAAGARLAHVALEALGVESTALFHFSQSGENSLRMWGSAAERWADSDNAIVRRTGRTTRRALLEEHEQEDHD